ncbi:MAG: dTDP-4-dehydrorhamnose reductase [Silvibacterium sp.]|nr:dTDP-4-dehydrorhamnose reductase [Silvibacterium sp.]MBV8438589.1 dTDP-4-dehydrorhamnose reductase [Silvibacterium sp.]
MRILLTGSDGQLGSEFRTLKRSTAEVISTGSRELDLTDEQETRRYVRDTKPSVIINTAAFSDMDAAERNWDACFALNAMAPVVLAEEAHRIDALLIHYSTDQVFAGTKTEPYVETDQPAPLNVFGASKLAGEEGIASSFARAIILRLGWTYSARSENFLRTILRLAQHSDELHVAADQIGTPTSARSVAQATERLVRMYADSRKTQFPTGIYHLAAGGATTWHGFASAILSMAPGSRKPILRPSETSENPSFARRPRYCVLSCNKFLANFGFQLAPWEQQLKEVMEEVRGLSAA